MKDVIVDMFQTQSFGSLDSRLHTPDTVSSPWESCSADRPYTAEHGKHVV